MHCTYVNAFSGAKKFKPPPPLRPAQLLGFKPQRHWSIGRESVMISVHLNSWLKALTREILCFFYTVRPRTVFCKLSQPGARTSQYICFPSCTCFGHLYAHRPDSVLYLCDIGICQSVRVAVLLGPTSRQNSHPHRLTNIYIERYVNPVGLTLWLVTTPIVVVPHR